MHNKLRPIYPKPSAENSQLTLVYLVKKTPVGTEDAKAANEAAKTTNEAALSSTRDCQHLCDECGKTFNNRNNLTSHLSSHSKKFHCEICDKQFRSSTVLRIHKRLHSGDLPFICSYCNRAFHSNTLLKIHIRVHTGEKPYRCTYCNASFGRHDRITNHVVRVHEPHRLLVCLSCGEKFVFRHQLREHASHHTGLKPHQCPQCDRCYRTQSLLSNHRQQKHNRWKQQQSIKQDGGRLSQSARLEKLACPTCGRVVLGKYYLAVHMRRHIGDFSLRCDVCNKGFSVRSDLENHKIMKHNGLKQFVCSHCNRRYASKKGLVQHTRTHTGEKPYSCIHCAEKFMFHSQLYVHLRKVHGWSATKTTSPFNSVMNSDEQTLDDIALKCLLSESH